MVCWFFIEVVLNTLNTSKARVDRDLSFCLVHTGNVAEQTRKIVCFIIAFKQNLNGSTLNAHFQQLSFHWQWCSALNLFYPTYFISLLLYTFQLIFLRLHFYFLFDLSIFYFKQLLHSFNYFLLFKSSLNNCTFKHSTAVGDTLACV